MSPDMQNNESRQRKSDKLFNLVDTMKLFIFLIGGGLAGTGVSFIAPTTAQLDLKVAKIEEQTFDHETRIINNNNKIDMTVKEIGDYVIKMQEIEVLRNQLLESKFVSINEKFEGIKGDIKELKELVKNNR